MKNMIMTMVTELGTLVSSIDTDLNHDQYCSSDELPFTEELAINQRRRLARIAETLPGALEKLLQNSQIYTRRYYDFGPLSKGKTETIVVHEIGFTPKEVKMNLTGYDVISINGEEPWSHSRYGGIIEGQLPPGNHETITVEVKGNGDYIEAPNLVLQVNGTIS